MPSTSASSNGEPSLLRVENARKYYQDGNVTALNDVSLQIKRGEYVAIMGKSGSGKSTLLNMIGALDKPTSGEIYFDGRPLSKFTSRELDRLRSEQIGFVFQSFHLLPTLTAAENVQIPMFELGYSPRQKTAKALELLKLVDLAPRADHLPNKLSGGERQRVAIARSLANDPILLLADEPTGNLDETLGAEIMNLFGRLHRERGTTLVVITHDPEVAERAHRVLHMKDGRVDSDTRTAASHA